MPLRPAPEGASSSFLKAFLSARNTIGAVKATSRGVARHMARLGGVGEAAHIAELGPGTGAIGGPPSGRPTGAGSQAFQRPSQGQLNNFLNNRLPLRQYKHFIDPFATRHIRLTISVYD